AGNGQAEVTFDAPADNGAAVTLYTVVSSPGNHVGTGASRPIAVAGLIYGAGYTVTGTATKRPGPGPPSGASDGGMAAGAPGAPATAGNGQAAVAFDAPPDNGAPVTLYTVVSSPGNHVGTGATSPIAVTGLTNGQSYTFTVTATNALGPGPPSGASNAVTPV